MEKQVRKCEVKFYFHWEYGVEISKIREDLDTLEKLGATHVQAEAYESYDCIYMSFGGYANREETDQEFKNRINELRRLEQVTKDRELEQLRQLKIIISKLF